MDGRRSLVKSRQMTPDHECVYLPPNTPLSPEQRKDPAIQMKILDDSLIDPAEASTLSMDSEDEAELENWRQMCRAAYIRESGHSFSVPVLDTSVSPRETVDLEMENEMEPTSEVIFHIGQNAVRAKRPRTSGSPQTPTGYTPRSSRARISVSKLVLPPTEEDFDKENIPVYNLPADEEIPDAGPIVLSDEEQSASSDIVEGLAEISAPDMAISPLETPHLSDKVDVVDNLEKSIGNMDVNDIILENEQLNKNVESGENSDLRTSEDPKLSFSEALRSPQSDVNDSTNNLSRNTDINSSLYPNVSPGPRPVHDLSAARSSEGHEMVSPADKERVPYSPRKSGLHVETPRTRVQAWMGTSTKSPDGFESLSPQEPSAHNGTPVKPGIRENSNRQFTPRKESEFQSCSEDEEPNAEDNGLFEEAMEEDNPVYGESRESEIDKMDVDTTDSFDFHNNRNQGYASSQTPVKSSQDDLDDTITQMEKLLALADAAEDRERELDLEKIDEFPLDLPCDEETSLEKSKLMSPSPKKSPANGTQGKRNSRTSRILAGPSSLDKFKKPSLIMQPFKQRYLGFGTPTNVNFNTPTGRAGGYPNTPKTPRNPTPTFTSTPHNKRTVEVPLSPASSVGSPRVQHVKVTPHRERIPWPSQLKQAREARAREIAAGPSPVIDYIYSTPPAVNISRAVKSQQIGSVSVEPSLSLTNTGGSSTGRKSGIPILRKLAGPTPGKIGERGATPILSPAKQQTAFLNPCRPLENMPKNIPYGVSPPPTRIPVVGGHVDHKEVRKTSPVISKGSENEVRDVGSSARRGFGIRRDPVNPLGTFNYFGSARAQHAAFKPIKLASPDPENGARPKIEVAIRSTPTSTQPNFVAQRHTGLKDPIENTSIVQKEPVKKAFIPSRIAKFTKSILNQK